MSRFIFMTLENIMAKKIRKFVFGKIGSYWRAEGDIVVLRAVLEKY